MYTIYKITNTLNKKVYVGCTKYTLEARMFQHLSVAQRSPNRNPLQRNIMAFGGSYFIIEAIETKRYKYVALDREMYWIKRLNSCCPNGYNVKGSLQYVVCEDSKRVGGKILRALKHNTMSWLSNQTGIKYGYLSRKIKGQDSFTNAELNAINRILKTNY